MSFIDLFTLPLPLRTLLPPLPCLRTPFCLLFQLSPQHIVQHPTVLGSLLSLILHLIAIADIAAYIVVVDTLPQSFHIDLLEHPGSSGRWRWGGSRGILTCLGHGL